VPPIYLLGKGLEKPGRKHNMQSPKAQVMCNLSEEAEAMANEDFTMHDPTEIARFIFNVDC
jgi:hypothetical protein